MIIAQSQFDSIGLGDGLGAVLYQLGLEILHPSLALTMEADSSAVNPRY
jgi:hypothetical protein